MSGAEPEPCMFAAMTAEERGQFVAELDQRELNAWPYDFRQSAHAGQLPPAGDWRTWLVMAGRGFGKTRAGAEWVRAVAEADPAARIALVGASLGEARAVMVEGESGILARCPPDGMPRYEPSLHRLRFPNGAEAVLLGKVWAALPVCCPVATRILRERGSVPHRPAAACVHQGRTVRSSLHSD